MNKLFTKIAALALGATMAVGVGVAVASTGKEADKADAADTTISLDFSSNSYGITTTQGNQTLTGDGATYGFEFQKGTGTGAKSNSGYILFGKTGVYFRNTSAPADSYISAISWTYSSGVSTNVVLGIGYGSSALDASASVTNQPKASSSGTVSLTPTDTSKSYFVVKVTNNYNCQWTSFSVTWSPTGGGTTNHDLTYAVGTQGVYDGSTTKTFSVAESGTHTVKSPADVGISANAGYVFSTWNDGTDNYNPSSTYTMGTSDVTLTAQWVAGVGLSYDKNNASATGSMSTTYVASGGTQTVADCDFELDGYTFSHWSTSADDNGTDYDPDDTIPNFTSALTLYAIWQEVHAVTIAYTNTSTTTNMTGNNDAATLGVSATDWSVVGYKGSTTNFPGLNKAQQIRLYGNANGGSYICVNTLRANRYITKIDLSTSNSTNFAVYEGDQTTSGTAVTGSNGTYTFGDDVTGFTIINTNSGTAQVYILSIVVYYEDETVSTPTLVLSNTPSSVGVGNSATFTVEYFALTSAFTVSTNTTYVTASYTGASGTGEATVTLTGVAVIASTTISVSATGATTQTFDVAVEVLPLINVSFDALTWGTTSYATSPHTVTWNSSYDFVVSAGQHNSGNGYLGTNNNNSAKSNVAGDDWTLKDSAIDAAIVADGSAAWLAHGQALYMSNFGVVHPTRFILNATNCSNSYTATYYILASTDSGDSWSVIGTGSFAKETDLYWTGNAYSSNSNPIQFAFVTTSASYGTISNFTVKVYGDSYATTKVLDSIYVSGTPTTAYTAGETFSLGSAKVYAHYTDSTTYPDEDVSSHVSFSEIAHGTTSVTITYLNKTTSVNVTVTDVGDIYKKATSLGELLDGSKVVIGSTAGTSLMGAQADHNRHSEPSETLGYYDSGDVSTYSINTAEFTVGIIEENDEVYYTFKDSSDRYLYAVASSNNYLRSTDTLFAAAKWHVEFDENVAGKALITTTVNYQIESVDTDVTKYMGGTASAYGCYTNANNAISIYVDVTNNITVFGETYMHMSDYSSNLGYCNDDSHHYYVTAKAALIAMGSDYIDELQTNNAHAAILARYNAWATACGDTTPFEGDGIVQAQSGTRVITEMFSESGNTITIVVIVSVISVTAIGGYFFLRKRREEN